MKYTHTLPLHMGSIGGDKALRENLKAIVYIAALSYAIMESIFTRQALEWLCLLRQRVTLQVMRHSSDSSIQTNCLGHESLHKLTSIIQSDVSVGNLMMNEEEDNPSWQSAMIAWMLKDRASVDEPSAKRQCVSNAKREQL